MTNCLARNTSAVSITVVEPTDGVLIGTLAAALPSNSTLRELSFLRCLVNGERLSLVFLALGHNTGLKSLRGQDFGSIDESLCVAIKDGLEMNETLESLVLEYAPLRGDNADLWCRAFSFLHTNKALKSLEFVMPNDCMESCLSAFCIDIVAMLQDNTSLESLVVKTWYGIEVKAKAEQYFVLLTVLQHNTSLRTSNLIMTSQFG
jgi:hypothetical protein